MQLAFHGLFEDLGQQLADTIGRLHVAAHLAGVGRQVVAIVEARRIEFRIEALHRFAHRPAIERLREIVLALLVDQLAARIDRHRGVADQRLHQIHRVLVVRVGLVELQHREFGIVPGRQTLVAEIAVDLVHAFEAADDEALQVQLRRDAQIQIAIQRVVVRDERPRRRAAGDRLQHRRLDFDEAERIEELADEAHRAAALLEHALHVGVDDQVDVALAVADLGVGQACPLLRQWAQTFHQQFDAADAQRQLAGLGAHHGADGADDVADVPGLEGVVGLGADRVHLHEQLDAARAVLDLDERHLALAALGHHATSQAEFGGLALERRRVPRGERAVQVFGERVAAEGIGEGLAARPQAFELLAPLGNQVILVDRSGRLRGSFGILVHGRRRALGAMRCGGVGDCRRRDGLTGPRRSRTKSGVPLA